MHGPPNPVPTEITNNAKAGTLNDLLHGKADVGGAGTSAYLLDARAQSVGGRVEEPLLFGSASPAGHGHGNITNEARQAHANIQLHEVTKPQHPRPPYAMDNLLVDRDARMARKTSVAKEGTLGA